VTQHKNTSYKEIANLLIDEMRKSNKLEEITSYGGLTAVNDEEYMSAEESEVSPSPQKKGKLPSAMSKEKKEKNVKRRVYDALNVLKAAHVLIENSKLVTCADDFYNLDNLYYNSGIASSGFINDQISQNPHSLNNNSEIGHSSKSGSSKSYKKEFEEQRQKVQYAREQAAQLEQKVTKMEQENTSLKESIILKRKLLKDMTY